MISLRNSRLILMVRYVFATDVLVAKTEMRYFRVRGKMFGFSEVKVKHQVLSGLLQPIMIPKWKWERVTIDFVSGLPVTLRKKDSIWAIVNRLKKSTHFISVRIYYSL
ncbi:integrase [Gossypium australe]|uniref:Integrase n=1 Tax=Gossypium australe TaxID=47621 RepID=A0A5B6WUQ7_9ROSI|nr:integrase [Gossypium australe]